MNNVDIKEIRNQLGLTQEEMAREMNVTAFTIRRWEKGAVKPQLVHRLRLTSLTRKAKRQASNEI